MPPPGTWRGSAAPRRRHRSRTAQSSSTLLGPCPRTSTGVGRIPVRKRGSGLSQVPGQLPVLRVACQSPVCFEASTDGRPREHPDPPGTTAPSGQEAALFRSASGKAEAMTSHNWTEGANQPLLTVHRNGLSSVQPARPGLLLQPPAGRYPGTRAATAPAPPARPAYPGSPHRCPPGPEA